MKKILRFTRGFFSLYPFRGRVKEPGGESVREGVVCSVCNRGREACQWCFDIELEDHEAICDCGLLGGWHLNDCRSRDGYKFVIVADYKAAEITR